MGVRGDRKAGRDLTVTELEQQSRSQDISLVHPAVRPSPDRWAMTGQVSGPAGSHGSKAVSGSARCMARHSTCLGELGRRPELKRSFQDMGQRPQMRLVSSV